MDAHCSDRLKILQVASHNLIRAGGAVQMMRLALALKARGHEVHCAFNIRCGDSPPGLGTFGLLHEAGIPVVSFPMQHLWKYPGMLQFRRYLARSGFQVVHTHRYRALHFVLQATCGMAVPALLGNKKNSFSVPRAWARDYGSPKVDAIVVNACVIRDLLVRTGRVSPDKVEIIYNGVDLERFNPAVDGAAVRAALGIDAGMRVFGLIANFARKKGHDVFFEAACAVARKDSRAVFLLVGGGDCEGWRRYVREVGLADRFIFAGYRTDIPQVIAAMDVSVIASRYGEGLTGSLVEAMAVAKPVISTDTGGNADFVQNGETGLLVPAGDPAQLAAAMHYCLENPQELSRMGRAGYESVRTAVDNEARTRRFENLYREILQRRSEGI